VGTLRVLVYHGARTPPSLHLVTTGDGAQVAEIADELLTQAADGVGVEVWCETERLYARGAVPTRKRD
jgi:hypothetical protein